MSWSYLSFRYHVIIVIFIFLAFFIARVIVLPLVITYLVLIFFYRKRDYLQQIDDPSLQKSLFSPVHGYITSIEKTEDHSLIKISVPWYERGDIVMPTNGEVLNYSNSPVTVDFITPKENLFSFILKSNRLVRRHPFYLWPGDRGRSRASVGFLLLGGEMLLKLSENYTIIVETNEKVEAGKTPLAIIKE